MRVPVRSWSVLACAVAMLAVASVAAAQIGEQLDEYLENNAEGYLQPLADAMGADLNSGIWRSAYVPTDGFYITVETHLMATFFDDAQRTFTYTPGEGDATPVDGADLEVPTVVGDTEGGTIPTITPPEIAYAPGFDINSFGLATLQFRAGAYKGTEGIFRFIASDFGDVEIGSISLVGVGARHSISQWLGPDFPVDLAAGLFWQNFKLGDDLIDATAMTYSVQVGKRFPLGLVALEPYGCLSYDTFKMDVSYELEDTAEEMDLEMESEPGVRATLGCSATLGFMDLNGEYIFGETSGFALGLGFAFRTVPQN